MRKKRRRFFKRSGFLKAAASANGLRLRNYWILAALGALAVLLASGGFRGLVRNYSELRDLRRQFSELKKDEGALNREILLFRKDDSHLEKWARSELDLMKPGEVEYRFKKEGAE